MSTLASELRAVRKIGRHPNLTRLLCDDCAVTSLVTDFVSLGSLDVLAKIEERDERAITDVLLAAAMQMLD